MKSLPISRYQSYCNYLVTSTINIIEQAAKLCKKIEKLRWQLESGIPLSSSKREAKEEEIKDLSKQIADLESKLTNLRVTKINVKQHLI